MTDPMTPHSAPHSAPPVHPPQHPKTAGTSDRIWTTRDLLKWMTDYFAKRNVDSPRLSAEILLAHTIHCERLRLYMEVDRPANLEELERLRGLVQRAGRHEPIAYLLGEGWFFGLRFKVTPDTLIPRPSTETLVEHILQHHRKLTTDGQHDVSAALLTADIGTGSGCIAIALAKSLPESVRFVATDSSETALDVAHENALTHRIAAERITFIRGDLLDPIESNPAWRGQLDYLVSNPPYVRDSEWLEVEPNVKDYEPVTALRAGIDGLDVIRPLITQAGAMLKPGTGVLAIEIAASQEVEAMAVAAKCPDLTDVFVLKDHEGFPRVIVARRNG